MKRKPYMLKNIRFEFKHASNVTKDERKYLRLLKIKSVGVIWSEYQEHKKDRSCFVTIAKNTLNRPVAWGVLWYDKSDRCYTFTVYVKWGYRRRGIASKIYRLTKQKKKLNDYRIKVYRHDKRSTGFYDKVQK